MDIRHSTSGLVKLEANVSSCTLGERAEEVSFLLAIAGLPRELTAIGKDTSSEGTTVVAAKTHKHNTNAWHLLARLDALCLEHGARGLLILRVNCEAVLVGHFNVSFSFVALDAGRGACGHFL